MSELKARFTSFDVGERLDWKRTDKPLGDVLQFEANHRFENGSALPAYKIQLRSGEALWFSAADLHRNCSPR